jgi:hypothetical protein
MPITTQRVPGLKQSVDWLRTITWPAHPEVVLATTDKVEAKVVEYLENADGTMKFTDAITHSLFTNQPREGRIPEFTVEPSSLQIFFPGEITRNWKLRAIGKPITRTVDNATTPPTVTLAFPKSILNLTILITDANGIDRAISGAEWEFEMEATTTGAGTPEAK